MRGSTYPRLLCLLLVAMVAVSCRGTPPDPLATPTPAPTESLAPALPTVSPAPSPSASLPSAPATVMVEVHFANSQLGDPCSEAFPVARQVPAITPLRGALEALLAGPTASERDAGYGGWFSRETAELLDGVRLEGSRALVDFKRTLPGIIPNASSSCGSISLFAQLDATATQFPSVDEAWYALEGDRAAFYGWLQFAAPDDPGPLPQTPDPTAAPTGAPDHEPLPPSPPSDRTAPASLRGTEWTSLPTSRKVVALTFDAGANGDAVGSILDTLRETGTPATFFLTGRWVTAYPTHATTIGTRHPVGNHSQTHPDLTTLDDAAVRAEIDGAEAAIRAATGRDPRPWFRFPYGARDARALGLVNDRGYGSVRWSVDTLGWQGTSGGMTAAKVVDRVLDDLHPGQIILMHVGSHPTDGSRLDADALPEIIRRIQAAGYRFIDLDQMLPDSG